LFASLQLIQVGLESDENDASLARFGDTTELCSSFQWDYKETMQQHDVQEFCMQLFDAIEQSFEQNGIFGVIGELYEGFSTGFVKCLTCAYESHRDSKFFDLQLTVKNDFDNEYNSSIE
jgi:hypothetical protein